MMNKKLLLATTTLVLIGFSTGAFAGQMGAESNNEEGISSYNTVASVQNDAKAMDKMQPAAGNYIADEDHTNNDRYNQD